MATIEKPKRFRERELIHAKLEAIHYSDVRVRVQMNWVEAESWCTKKVTVTSQSYAIRSIAYSHSVIGGDGVQYHWAIGTYLNTGHQVFLLVAIDFK